MLAGRFHRYMQFTKHTYINFLSYFSKIFFTRVRLVRRSLEISLRLMYARFTLLAGGIENTASFLHVCRHTGRYESSFRAGNIQRSHSFLNVISFFWQFVRFFIIYVNHRWILYGQNALSHYDKTIFLSTSILLFIRWMHWFRSRKYH